MNLFLFHLVYVGQNFSLLSDTIQNGKAVHFGYNPIHNAVNIVFCRYVPFTPFQLRGRKMRSIFPSCVSLLLLAQNKFENIFTFDLFRIVVHLKLFT